MKKGYINYYPVLRVKGHYLQPAKEAQSFACFYFYDHPYPPKR